MDNKKKIPKNMKPANCPECLQHFLFRDFCKKKKQPLLIGCGHSVCETCIRTAVTAKRDVVCKYCSFMKKFEPEMADDLQSFFPLDQFTVGRLMRVASIDCESSVEFRKNVKKPQTGVSKTRQKCSECGSKFEEVKCKQCDVPFCEACFDLVHGSSFRSLKSHEKLPLAVEGSIKSIVSIRTPIEITSCAEHKDQKQDFYCKTCSQQLCSRCAVMLHPQHEVVLLSDQNKLKQKSLDEALEKATRIYKRLLFTRKKAQASLHSSDQTSSIDYTQLKNEISMQFQLLHGVLQIRENQLLDMVKNYENEQVSSLNEIIEELTISLKDTEMALKEAKQAMMPDNFRLIDANNILSSLQEVCTKPCFLLLANEGEEDSNRTFEDNTERIKFVMDDKLSAILKDCGSISSPPRKKYVLKSEEDLPEDFKADPVPEEIQHEPFSLEKELPERGPSLRAGGSVVSSGGGVGGAVRLWTSSISDISNVSTSSSVRVLDVIDSVNVGGDGYRRRQQGSDTAESAASGGDHHRGMPIMMPKTGNTRRDLSPGTIEEVKISHIINPSLFYVHRKRANQYLEKISLTISKMLNMRDTPKEIKEGWIYLVKFSVDNKWYRARVTKYINENQILVHFIDFGNEDICTLKSFRSSTDKINGIQPLANQCKLYQCHPNPGPEWSSEANKMMAAMCKNSTSIRMHVIHNRDNSPLEVDLRCYINGASSLVRDTLVFHSFATYENGQHFSQLKSLMYQTQYNPSKHVHRPGTEVIALVTHVEDPFHFYINSDVAFYKKLMVELNNFYTHPSQAEPKIFYPSIDMAVAVFDEITRAWYRAKITKHPGNQTVELFFVDTGRTATVYWSSLRGLENKFLRSSYLAVKCELFSVAPKNVAGWTEDVKEAFRTLVLQKVVKVRVAEERRTGLAVVLYQNLGQGEKCINHVLIEQGLAASVSLISPFAQHVKKKALLPTPNTKKQPFEQTIKTAGYKSLRARKYQPQEPQISPVTSIAAAKHEPKREEAEEEEELDEQQKLDAKRFPCTIIKIIDPSHFYIMFDAALWDRMKKDITEFYSKEENREQYNKEDWKEGDFCVFLNKDKIWYRAIIARILPDNKAELLVKDIVEEVTVATSELYNLKDEFKDQDICVRCHLCDLRAPGGQGVWPSIAIEEFQEHVSNRKVYFMQKGEVDAERKSLPAELWLRSTVIEPGPLEPEVNEWYTVNKYLVDKGLALPDAPHTSSDRFITPLLKALMLDTKKSAKGKEKDENEEDKSESETSSPIMSLVNLAKKKKESSKNKEQYVNPGITDWLPPEPFHDLKLTTAPTYVDFDCNVYIQDTTSVDTLRIIETSLQSKYRDSKPSAHDSFWSAGQLCIVQYHADAKWYRGKVQQVLADNTYKVVMVDYGNVEICKASDMRKNLLMTQIPLQCHACAMTCVKPVSNDGKWSTKVLDYIHATVVDRVCDVELAGSNGNYSIVNIVVLPGMTLTNLLLNLQYAVEAGSDDNDSSAVSSSSDESEEVVIEKEVISAASEHSDGKRSVPAVGSDYTDDEQSNQLKILESIATGAQQSRQKTPSPIPTAAASSSSSSSVKTSWLEIMEADLRKAPKKSVSTGSEQRYKYIELTPDVENLEIEMSSILSATTIFCNSI
ncbi:hypothetical protein LSTR_LSTR005500 [Laodelphax striatellus]|uniref:RING finger protein 17 n=1 Tax=Laodelphax striatellus TaxID=195883 RepID=A0A482WX13_LAOST|nr:hypothetical protein LSTR_LSTR005500 [Laodelphax striatellus]